MPARHGLRALLSLPRQPRCPAWRRGVSGAAAAASPAAPPPPVPPPLLESYDALKSVVREVTALGEVEGLLSYDEQCFMPPGAAAARAAQKGALATATHALATGGAMRAAVEALRGREGDLPTPRMQANVRLATRAYDQQARKPAALAAREAELESEAFGAWQRARAEADFSLFAPLLEQVVALKREVALVTRPEICGGGDGGGGGAGGAGVYDGALDSFEVGMRGVELDALFATLRARLLPLLQRIQAKQAAAPGIDAPHAALRAGDGAAEWDVEAQAALSRSVAADMGYSFEHGRLDVSTHPFTGGGGPTDVRITTRFSASNPWEGLGATVHEAGHALYEQGRDMDAEEGARLPASGALSMGVHESQSLLWERLVLQSEECWQYLAPKVHAAFPATAAVAPSDFHRAYNRVCPGLIRVEADEVTCPLHAIDPARQVTYPLHVILRFDIERALMAGDLEVADVPRVWAQRMKSDLGLEVPDDGVGCLQDIHWSFGAIGYFPSYTLGALLACQLFSAAGRDLGDEALRAQLRRGEFAPLREWLREHVHLAGSLDASANALARRVCGEPLSPEPFLAYLEQKYARIYEL